MTRRFVLIGHPVGHSVSPAIHAAAYEALGIDARYEAIDCPAEVDVEAQVAAIRNGTLAGGNVTVPHKRLALSLADDVDASASSVGAANVLSPALGRVVAHNTDVPALAQEIRVGAERVDGAAVIGSGGAALASVAALRGLGARRIVVVARRFSPGTDPATWPSAETFRRLGAEPVAWAHEPGSDWHRAVTEADVVVQATSAGMKGADDGTSVVDVVPWSDLRRGVFLYDLVYNPPRTPFYEAAVARGLSASTGLGMLVGQAAEALRIWLGVEPPTERMRAAAEAALFGRGTV